MRGMRARWSAVLRIGRYGLAARGPEGEGGLDLEPLFDKVVADAGHRQASGVHGVPYHHAAERDQVPRRGRHYSEREQQHQRRHGGHPHGDGRDEEGVRHVRGPARRGPGGEEDHAGEEQHDCPEVLQAEDVVYDVANCGELHEGAYHGDGYVLLQVEPLVEAEDHRHGHEPQG